MDLYDTIHHIDTNCKLHCANSKTQTSAAEEEKMREVMGREDGGRVGNTLVQ